MSVLQESPDSQIRHRLYKQAPLMWLRGVTVDHKSLDKNKIMEEVLQMYFAALKCTNGF